METLQQVTRPERALGRLELIQWVNASLTTDYADVRNCADGVAYCQLVDSVLPGRVPLTKLNFNAHGPDDNLRNLRVLEEALGALGVRKTLDVEALAKGRFKVRTRRQAACIMRHMHQAACEQLWVSGAQADVPHAPRGVMAGVGAIGSSGRARR